MAICKPNFFLLTGGPGVGKTTLIEELHRRGERVVEETHRRIIREARANNIQGDVSIISDAPAAMAQLIPLGFVESWLPPEMAGNIPPEYQDPLTVVTSANVWAYNSELFDKCPVSNIWELTDPKWKGKS